jgi:hypothetical protein
MMEKVVMRLCWKFEFEVTFWRFEDRWEIFDLKSPNNIKYQRRGGVLNFSKSLQKFPLNFKKEAKLPTPPAISHATKQNT